MSLLPQVDGALHNAYSTVRVCLLFREREKSFSCLLFVTNCKDMTLLMDVI